MGDTLVQWLVATLTLTGVSTVPSDLAGWKLTKTWTQEKGVYTLEASSAGISEVCKSNRDSVIIFPRIIHGAHEVSVGGKRILTYGDPTFQKATSFYGSPVLTCRDLGGEGLLEWKAYSYTQYFARITHFPEIRESAKFHNFYSEILNVLAAGTLIMLAFFTFLIFWGKVPSRLSLSVSLSSLFLSIYFLGTVNNYFGVTGTMLTVHKIADFGLYIGLVLYFNALRIHGLIGNKLFGFYFGLVGITWAMILSGTNGDMVQFGTSLPFGLLLFMAVLCMYQLIRDYLTRGFQRKIGFELLSLGSFFVSVVNDILVVSGVRDGQMVLALGFIGALLFIALSVNEQIVEIYREHDYLRSHLEDEVRIKTSALEHAMVELKGAQAELVESAKLASLGTLSAGIAHEINNSLNYVHGGIKPLEKLVQGDMSDPKKKEQASKLLFVMNEGLKLTFEIIKSLRNFTGLNQAKFDDLDLSEVVQSVLTLLKSRIPDTIKIEKKIPSQFTVHASVVGLNQILMNLITNALDAMDNAGTLTISATDKLSAVEIRVADTGRGIAEDIKDRIFEPFFTTKKVGSGMGLGLYMSKREIERHGGTIRTEKAPEKGTVFIVSIPRQMVMLEAEAA